MNQIQIAGLSGLEQAAREFAALLDDRTVIAFRGAMGAGKLLS